MTTKNTVENNERINLAIDILSKLFPTFGTSNSKFEVIELLQTFLKKIPLEEELNTFVKKHRFFFPVSFEKDLPLDEFKKLYQQICSLISNSAENIPKNQYLLMLWDESITYVRETINNKNEKIYDGPLFYPKKSMNDNFSGIGRTCGGLNTSIISGPRSTISDIKFIFIKSENPPDSTKLQKINLYPGEIYIERRWFEKKFLGFLCFYNNNLLNKAVLDSIKKENRLLFSKFKSTYESDNKNDDSNLGDSIEIFDKYLSIISDTLSEEYFNQIFK